VSGRSPHGGIFRRDGLLGGDVELDEGDGAEGTEERSRRDGDDAADEVSWALRALLGGGVVHDRSSRVMGRVPDPRCDTEWFQSGRVVVTAR
jgi:hypothetical protein